MSGIATAIGVTGLVSAGASIVMGDKAADSQKDASNYAQDVNYRMYEQNREDLMPFRDIELARAEQASEQYTQVIDMIEAGPGVYEQSPGYDAVKKEGEQSIVKAAGVHGAGGGTLKALSRFNYDLRANDFDRFRNRWLSDVSLRLQAAAPGGAGTATSIANMGAQSAALQGGYIQDAGAAKASGYLNTAGAINQGLNSIVGAGTRYLANAGGGGSTGAINWGVGANPGIGFGAG